MNLRFFETIPKEDDGNDDPRPPLHIVCEEDQGLERATSLLLESGTNVDLKDLDGSTALHSAAHMGALKYVQFLLENGAQVLDASCCWHHIRVPKSHCSTSQQRLELCIFKTSLCLG
jgi:ankyrin repeat protein